MENNSENLKEKIRVYKNATLSFMNERQLMDWCEILDQKQAAARLLIGLDKVSNPHLVTNIQVLEDMRAMLEHTLHVVNAMITDRDNKKKTVN